MRIRKAIPKDTDSIRELADLLHLEIPEFVWNTDEYITRQIEKGEYFVAEEKERIVGIVSFRVRRDKMYIETLAVAKEFWQNNI